MGSNALAEILAADAPEQFACAVTRATDLLRAGQVVALPTETVYGLAANALDALAVSRIYEAKGRPANNPIIVHVADVAMAQSCVAAWPPAAARLAQALWPGPLTLVLPRSPAIPDIVAAGGPTVAVRWPRHPLMEAVIRKCGFPLAAPSANPSGRTSPTTARHVLQGLGQRIPLVIDGGPTPVGIESTVVDLSGVTPILLRPGMIHAAELEASLGIPIQRLATASTEGTLRSPGLLSKHYAPKARLILCSWQDEYDLGRLVQELVPAGVRCRILAHTAIPSGALASQTRLLSLDPHQFAQRIFAELHECDTDNIGIILVEEIPPGPAWDGIRDRLQRAAHG
jgi:L-threonylcarbamoyladenylate synthase